MQKRTYVCPYCFTEHKSSELCFRCVNAKCKKKPDLSYAEYACKAPELKQMTFTGTKKWFGKRKYSAICPLCQSSSERIICPSCHNVLPKMGRNNQTIILSAVGGMDAGKSSYLAVLMHELKRKIACLLHGSASFMEETSAREYEDRFLQYLYPYIGTEPSLRIPKTKSSIAGGESIRANRPILMSFQFMEEGWEDTENHYTFVFYDEAGEDFEEETLMFTLAKQIEASNGIFFFIDPLKIAYVRNSLKEEVVKGAATTKDHYGSEADAILLRLANVLRVAGKLEDEEKIDLPVAVILPKLDVLLPLLSENSPLRKSSLHQMEKGYVRQEGFDIQEELKGLLYEWGEQEVLSHLEANFSRYQLFSVSAFGNNPDAYGRFYLPHPVRIEDPFLWMLKELEIIHLRE